MRYSSLNVGGTDSFSDWFSIDLKGSSRGKVYPNAYVDAGGMILKGFGVIDEGGNVVSGADIYSGKESKKWTDTFDPRKSNGPVSPIDVVPMNRSEFIRDTSSYKGGSGGAVFGFSRLEFQGWRYIPFGE